MSALGISARWREVRAHWGATVIDSVLVMYVMWAWSFLSAEWRGAPPTLTEGPWLLATAPLWAALWQALMPSWGQRYTGLRIDSAPDEAATNVSKRARDRRAQLALVTALEWASMILPAMLWPGTGLAISLLMAAAFVLSSLAHSGGQSPAARLTRIHTSAEPAAGEDIASGPTWGGWRRRIDLLLGIWLLSVTGTIGMIVTEFDLAAIFSGAGRTSALWAQLFAPDWTIADRVITRMVETVFLALMASALALPLAGLLGFLGAHNLMGHNTLGQLVYYVSRALMNIVRSIEPLVWAIMFVLWVGVGPFAGMLALLVHSAAALGKLYSEAVESIDIGPIEAIRATGASALQVLRFAVVPQVVAPFLSFTVYRWDINVRMATILGLVGGGGIGDLLINYQQLGAWSKVGTVIVCITAVVWAMDVLSSKARERLL